MLALLHRVCLILVVFHSTVGLAISPLQVVGSKFFRNDGSQFFMKGVAYQLTEDDPLINNQQCQLDATLMQQLGANAIRVYHVNQTADHSACMTTFANAGIYLFVDLDTFDTYIRNGTTPSWTVEKYNRYRAVIDNFQQYNNTAGFFVGNEVLNTQLDSGSAPYLLAATADLRKYRDSRQYRKIPIGYSATDTGALPMLQDYLVCRPNVQERLEFYALNSYRWCGPDATYNTSGYNLLQAASEGYPIPLFFSEDGCNTLPPRDFHDQAAIFGPEMSGTWSGAMIYEWIQEMNQYGLITYGPQQAADVQAGSSVIQGFTRQGTPTPIQPDFANLKAQWATASPSSVQSSNYINAISTQSRSCPAFTAGGWTVDPSASLPTLGQAALAGETNITSTHSATTNPSTPGTQSQTQTHSGTAATASASSQAGRNKIQMHPLSTNTHDNGMTGLSMTLVLALGIAIIMFLL